MAADEIELQFGYVFGSNIHRAELAKTGGKSIHYIAISDYFIYVFPAFIHPLDAGFCQADRIVFIGNLSHCLKTETIAINDDFLHFSSIDVKF